ncbi:hypothetical protein [Leptobacterium sp. I13]|uniref:hypothetical protein n=1 Tax=Leptobacterium meishanense TaxID=3128904 RepID=UPI0030EBC8E8
MITPEQKTELKKLLKGDYIADVKQILQENNVLTKKGVPYSDKMISHVFNGRYHNPKIESAIMQVYIERKQIHDEDQQFKNKILGLQHL